METMKAVYRCRLCEERYFSGAETGQDIAARCMAEMNAGMVPIGQAPRKTETHCCGGPFTGCLGLADFLGWEEQP